MAKLTKLETVEYFRKLSDKYKVLDYSKTCGSHDRFYIGKMGTCKPLFLACSRVGWVCVYVDKPEKVLLTNNGFICEKVTSGDERYEYKAHIDSEQFVPFLKIVGDYLNLRPSKLNRELYISSNDIINDLIYKVNNEKSIALDLISLFGNDEFENELYQEAFGYLEHIINDQAISKPQKLCVVIALTFIALKFYNGDLHSHIEEKAKQFFERKDYSYVRIQNAVYAVLGGFRQKMQYEDQKSYVAVPVIMSCAPYYRVFDLFKLSYDIYKKKLLFDEDISDEQIYGKVKETLESIRKRDLIDYSDRIKGTNYLMSKYTQSCIYTGVELPSLVSIITNCIRYIIDYVTMPRDSYIVEEYYLQGFNQWVEFFEGDENERARYEQSKSISKPSLSLYNCEVYLKTGEVEFDDSLNPNEVHIIIYNDGQIIEDYHIYDPEKIEYMDPDDVFGGYVLRQCTLLLGCNPLNNLQYIIEVSGHEVYNSKDKLYRTVAFFDGKGKEIKPGKDYDGELFVLHRHDVDESKDEVHTLQKCDGYYISTTTVNSTDLFVFDGEPFVFYKIDGAKSLGYRVPWAEFESMEKRKYPIYNTALFLMQSSSEVDDISVKIDDQKFKITDKSKFKVFKGNSANKVDGNRTYYFQLIDLAPGFHKIKAFDDLMGKEIKGASFELVIDAGLNRKALKINIGSDGYLLESDFIENQNVEFSCGLPQKEIKAFVKNLGHGKLYLYPTSISYSYNNKEWYRITDDLLIYDIDSSIESLSFCGPMDLKAYYFFPGAAVETYETNLKTDNEYPTMYHLSLDYLRANKRCKNINLVCSGLDQILLVKHRPQVLGSKCRFYHDDEKMEHHFHIAFASYNEVYAIIKDRKTGRKLFEEYIKSGDEIVLRDKDIPATVQYVSVSLHMKKSNSLFSNYEAEAFHTFEKYNVERFFFAVKYKYIKLNYINSKRILTVQFELTGEKTAFLRINAHDNEFKHTLFRKNISSGEVVNIDATLWPFDSITLDLFPTGINNDDLAIAKPVCSYVYKLESLFLHKTFYIRSVITNKGQNISTAYNLSIMRIEAIDGKYCLICKLFNKKNFVTIFDVVFIPLEIGDKRIVGFICKKTLKGFEAISLGNKIISKVVLDRNGGTYE